jgi:chromosome segregation ATPase
MRDIRNDLQERARLVEHEITTVNSRLQNTMEQLQKERDKRVAELNAELTSLRVLIETEEARLANAQRPAALGQHQYALSDFLMRKLVELSPVSGEELCSLAVQEGHFAHVESAGRDVHGTLAELVRMNRIRQLADGKLVPVMLSQTFTSRGETHIARTANDA